MKRLVFLITVFCVVVCGSMVSAEIVSRFVAVVNGEGITKDDLEKAMIPFANQVENGIVPGKNMDDLRKQVLEKMIDDKLLVQEARRYDIEVTDIEIQNHMDQFRSQYGLSEEEFKSQLLKEQMTMEEYREKVRDQIRTRRLVSVMVRSKVVVTDQEVEKFFDEHKNELAQSGNTQIWLIVTETESLAEDLRAQINNGDITFADAARANSIGPEAQNGGNLGEFNLTDLGADWQAALNSVEDEEVAAPFAMENGFALVAKKTLGSDGSVALDGVRDQIFQELYNQKMQMYMAEYLEKLRDKAILEIML